MMRGLLVYRDVIAATPARFALLLALTCAATLFEGSALLLLIPLIDQAGGAPATGGVALELLSGALGALGVPGTPLATVAAFAAVGACSVTLTWVAARAMHAVTSATEARMRRELHEALMAIRWPELARERTGDIVKAITSDPVQGGLGAAFLLLGLTAGLSGLAYVALAGLLSWELTLLTAAFALLILPIYRDQMRRTRAASAEASRLEEELTAEATEALSHAKLIFSLGLRRPFTERFASTVGRQRGARFRRDVQVDLARLIFEFAVIAFVCLVLFLAIGLGRWPIGTAIVFLAMFARIAPRFITFQGCLLRAANHAIWIENWRGRLAAYRAAQARPSGGGEPRFERSLELDGVSFRYPTKDEQAVGDASLSLRYGECVALVGPSGHGKSTLVDLATGLIAPDAGEVRIDGTPLAALDLVRWQRMIGLVPQDAPLLHGSVRENVVFGDADGADEGRLRRALALADAAEFVTALPDGLDTPLGERGAQLSGGQRQRLALARALYRRPRLLILDEATSALDAATAARVVENLRGLKGETTMLVVSHAADLLRLADRVLRVEGGRVLAGPPAQERAG